MSGKQPEHVLIFDLDGVLIEPAGYKKAFLGALKYFLSRMGVKGFDPSVILHTLFESIGISWEWDMIPLTLALFLEKTWDENRIYDRYRNLENLFSQDRTNTFLEAIQLEDEIDTLRGMLLPGMAPSASIYFQSIQQKGDGLFKHLSRTFLFEELLNHTREIKRCITSQVFQSYCIGSKDFRAITKLHAVVQTDSF